MAAICQMCLAFQARRLFAWAHLPQCPGDLGPGSLKSYNYPLSVIRKMWEGGLIVKHVFFFSYFRLVQQAVLDNFVT